jgi:hypothetical protein
MIIRALSSSVLLSCGFVAAMSAQARHAWRPDSNAVQFAWVSANVVVTATDSDGVAVWAFTARSRDGRQNHDYHEQFDPEPLLAWLNQAHVVAAYRKRPAPADSAPELHTAPLAGRHGGRLALARARVHGAWSDRIEFVFDDSAGARPWSIGATRVQADSLIMSLFTRAARSRLIPHATPPDTMTPSTDDRPPILIRAGSRPPLPPDLQGQNMRVLMQFVIGTDGRPEADSFVAEFYDDPRLADIAYQTFMDSRYEPGRLKGKPVRVKVRQGVSYFAH